MEQTGVIILAHGSRGEWGSVEVPRVLRRVTDGVRPLLSPGVEVVGAALQFNHPNLEEAVEYLAIQGMNRILIMPYFLFPGRHITEHIPQLVDQFRRMYPEKEFILASPLGLDKTFIAHVAECIVQAAPELSPNGWPSVSPGNIERQSMDIVEKLLPPLPIMSEEERAIVKRIVHASGDLEIARLIKFGPSANSSGLGAIANGAVIFTDVRMVATGINEQLVKICGCSLSCAMDERRWAERSTEENFTRTASAMHHLGNRLNGAIVAIGNAPTALLALVDMIDNRNIAPALVVGMPVGFVQAREAKAELMKRNIPYIVIEGTRGGSALAAATVNALLKLAQGRMRHSQPAYR
jgi:precorrin-8X/cobalt-precorrin-8 methylmutase